MKNQPLTAVAPIHYFINATVKGSKHSITIIHMISDTERQRPIVDWLKSLNIREGATDWQTAICVDLKEVRSTIMHTFGIGWFNRARRRILELEAAQTSK